MKKEEQLWSWESELFPLLNQAKIDRSGGEKAWPAVVEVGKNAKISRMPLKVSDGYEIALYLSVDDNRIAGDQNRKLRGCTVPGSPSSQ